MKYKVGDKVRIKPKYYFCSVDGFKNIHMKDEFFNQYSRLPYCETVMTIGIVHEDFYVLKEDRWTYKWTDDMIECKVEEEIFDGKYHNDLPTMEDVSKATLKGDIKNSNGNFWKKELKKCSLDKSRRYMIETYIFKSPLWFGQRELLECMTKRHVTLSVKSRAVGYTSLMAALTACEMVLNSDMEDISDIPYNIIYIAQRGQERSMFIKQVIEYLDRIPKQLWTADCKITSTNRKLCVGNSRLIVDSTSMCDIVDSTEKPKIVIYDEMVSANNAYSYDNTYDKYLFEVSDKVIIGGCANHRNEKFYNFVKEYKEKYGSFVKMIWEDNPNHTEREYKMKKSYCCDVFEFSDEFDCEVFKLIKEKL